MQANMFALVQRNIHNVTMFSSSLHIIHQLILITAYAPVAAYPQPPTHSTIYKAGHFKKTFALGRISM